MLSKTVGQMLTIAVFMATASFAQLPNTGRANVAYQKLPLTFEVNRGQTDSQVKFFSRGPGYTAFLTTGGMVLSLRAGTVVGSSAPPERSGATTVQFTLDGAAKNPTVQGEDPQTGRVNYFFGSDPAKWHTNVPIYSRVRYENVYPGIDLVYYGNHQQLEYDFEIQPGADPHRVQFDIRGATHIELDHEGNLTLNLGNGEIRFQSPIIYQESRGHRVPIRGNYVMTDSTHIAFKIADYDVSKPLVVDPVLIYATYLGGSGADQATSVAVDNGGNVYVAGYTNSSDFLLTTLGTPAKTANHVFVAKLDPTGSNLVYADYVGGDSEDYAFALVLDSANDVFLTGSTTSSNFPTVKAYQSMQPGPYSGFLTEISPGGSSLVYSTYLGGSTLDQPASLAIDGLGQVFVAGLTQSRNFPVANAYQSIASANQAGLFGLYGFLTKFSADGSSLVYSTYLAGNSNVVQNCGSPCWPTPYNAVNALAVDANGNAYVAGITNTYNFPVTPGAFLASNSTQQDTLVGFVSKFTSAGSLGYSTYFYQSSGIPIGALNAIAVDGSGSAYITGAAESDGTFPITSTSICDPAVYGLACSYAFVSKFDPTGSTLLYSTFLGPDNNTAGQALALDPTGNAFVVGSTQNPQFQTNNAIEAWAGQWDILLVEIDPSGTTQLFSTYLGGSGNEAPSAIALDAVNDIYVAGFTNSTDFSVTEGAFQSHLGGNNDAFVAKIGEGSAPAVSLSPSVLQYPPQPLGSTTQPQQVILRNMSSLPLAVASIGATGDFAQSNNCGSGLAAAATCTIFVTFTPTAPGSRSGSVLITDNALGSPQQVTLEGSGIGAVGVLTPVTLSFPSTELGIPASQTVALANQGNAVLNISNVQVTGDYAQTNNCPAALAATATCTFNVVFTPTATGTRTGQLTVSDSAAGSPQAVALSGIGTDFTLTASPTSATVKPGNTATYALSVAPVGGPFTDGVSLACSGTPQYSTCNLSSASVTPGSNTATVSVTISTTASALSDAALVPANHLPVYAGSFKFLGLGFLGLVIGSGCRRGQTRCVITLALAGTLLFMTACAGGTGISKQKQPGTPPGTYTVTLTGTSGVLQHSAPVTLTVQ